MLSYSNGVQISQLVPGARLHTMQGVGHLFWWERSDETIDAVREHLLGADADITCPDAPGSSSRHRMRRYDAMRAPPDVSER